MEMYVYKIEFGPKNIPIGTGKRREFLVVVAPDAEAAAREFHRIMPNVVIHESHATWLGIDASEVIHSVAPECFPNMQQTDEGRPTEMPAAPPED